MDQESKPEVPGLIKFRTGYGADRIERVEVLRETSACVYLPRNATRGNPKGEQREAKLSEFAQYHDTWNAAHAYLIRKAEGDVDMARGRLEVARGKLGNIKGMKPPKER
jgi:hypothetical protein